MVRGLILGSAVVATALASASFPAVAYGCRNGRSTDPNCYREYGYVCGPCYNDWGGDGWRRNDGWRGGWAVVIAIVTTTATAAIDTDAAPTPIAIAEKGMSADPATSEPA
jgi:hypothetical protein